MASKGVFLLLSLVLSQHFWQRNAVSNQIGDSSVPSPFLTFYWSIIFVCLIDPEESEHQAFYSVEMCIITVVHNTRGESLVISLLASPTNLLASLFFTSAPKCFLNLEYHLCSCLRALLLSLFLPQIFVPEVSTWTALLAFSVKLALLTLIKIIPTPSTPTEFLTWLSLDSLVLTALQHDVFYQFMTFLIQEDYKLHHGRDFSLLYPWLFYPRHRTVPAK